MQGSGGFARFLYGGPRVDHEGMGMENGAKLTKRVVDAAEPRGKRYEIWDSELPGFGLRIEPSGKKAFFVRYRVGGGRAATRRNMSIGGYGTVTPEQARIEAKKLLGQAANGHDPSDVRSARRREMTIADLLSLYEQRGCVIQRGFRQGQPMKPMTKRQTLKRLRNRCGTPHWPEEAQRRPAEGYRATCPGYRGRQDEQ